MSVSQARPRRARTIHRRPDPNPQRSATQSGGAFRFQLNHLEMPARTAAGRPGPSGSIRTLLKDLKATPPGPRQTLYTHKLRQNICVSVAELIQWHSECLDIKIANPPTIDRRSNNLKTVHHRGSDRMRNIMTICYSNSDIDCKIFPIAIYLRLSDSRKSILVHLSINPQNESQLTCPHHRKRTIDHLPPSPRHSHRTRTLLSELIRAAAFWMASSLTSRWVTNRRVVGLSA